MNKQEALGDFFQGLHTVINNAFAYVKDHPYFLKSVEEFKAKLDQLFLYLAPLKIAINPASLFVDGRLWEKVRLYEELAQIFHLRKIKSVEFRPGVSVQELTVFFGKLSLPPKEILKGGGLANILEAQARPHIVTEELD
ncbi:MAG: hypothetical protein Q8N85_05535, partial [Candidatus Omnitrophota bacterium]|nr:hypothetical protein [Candidatus Omnitrophota bacterium]